MRISTPKTLASQGWQTDPDALEQLGIEEDAEAIRVDYDRRQGDISRYNREDEEEARRKRKRK